MKIKVGINGMGRIGRMILRSIIERNNKTIEIKHINNRTNSELCSSLLKYDSVHGKFEADINYDRKHLIINKNKIEYYLNNSLMLVTALAPKIGYDNAAKIAKAALKNKTTLKIEALKSGLINKKEYEKIVDPKKMIHPE